MGAVLVPPKVLKKLTTIVRNFFWGGGVDKRPMAYVAWDKVTVPKGMGGLDLRSLSEMNKALVIKCVWKIASQQKALWIEVMKAKYYPRSCFLTSNKKTRDSKVWKDMINVKPHLLDHMQWQIGGGEEVMVFSQPWFPNWIRFRVESREQREMTVASLIDQQSRSWDFYALTNLFGFQEALHISLLVQFKPGPDSMPDTLIFTYAKNGRFSVQKAYQLLKGIQGDGADKAFWNWLWHNNQLIPKLKLFDWLCLHDALPVKAVLSHRIQSITPLCQICNMEQKTITHALFHCDQARASWWASPMSLRTDGLQGDWKTILKGLLASLPEEDICSFICMAWAIWQMRNDIVLGGKQVTLVTGQQYYINTLNACKAFVATNSTQSQAARGPQEPQLTNETNQNLFVCYVDRFWSADGRGGIGVCLTIHNKVIKWLSKLVNVLGPAQSEARGVLEAYKLLQLLGCQNRLVVSDSLEQWTHSCTHRPWDITGEHLVISGVHGQSKTRAKEDTGLLIEIGMTRTYK